jgi:hypothetical protein
MVGEKWRPRLEGIKKELDGLVTDEIDLDGDMPLGIVDGVAHLHSELEANGIGASTLDAKAGK